MPGNVPNATVPVVAGVPLVLPFALARAFTEVRTWQARVNEYHDGTTQRQATVATSRKAWKLTHRLAPAAMGTMRAFLLTYPTDPFYFYSPTEPAGTQPDGSNFDPTGISTQGRYIVRFNNGDLSEQIFIPRAETSIELLEIA